MCDTDKLYNIQRHAPLVLLSGRFNGTQLGHATLEKEGFAFMATLERVHWLVFTQEEFDLFTDHSNLIFIFDPMSVCPDLSKTTLCKILRWAVRFSIYDFNCFHINGTKCLG